MGTTASGILSYRGARSTAHEGIGVVTRLSGFRSCIANAESVATGGSIMSRTAGVGLAARQIATTALTLPFVFAAPVCHAQDAPNACPVDGCLVTIVDVKKSGDELELTYELNFTPDVSKNHVHAWWGDQFTVEQVSRNAEAAYGVTQGRWHRHDDHPAYVTKEAVSTSVRNGSSTICVSAADRDHNILDTSLYHCVDVSGHL
jgi:hypothetical protein